MCDINLVLEMKKRQQLEPLECNPGPNCWCSKVSYRFPLVQTDDCMSPIEMYEMGESDLSSVDKKYLKSLFGRDFTL